MDVIDCQHLAQDVSEVLLNAIKNLVYKKYQLDKFMSRNRHVCTECDLYDGGYGPLEPYDFFSKLFPFVFKWNGEKKLASVQVPTEVTVGCSWRWRPEHAEAPIDEWIKRFNFDHAKYGWIKPLGLVIPHEGKNRADYLRENGIRHITADVTEYSYPEASRLSLCRINLDQRIEYWAIFDERWIQRIRHPDWVLPVLQAYGVKIIEWPELLPDIRRIDCAFASPPGHPEFLNANIVDTDKVGSEEHRDVEVVDCCLFDVDNIQFNWNYIIKRSLLGVFAASVIIFFSDKPMLTMGLPAYIVGFVAGLTLIVAMPSLRVFRKGLREDLR